MKKTPIRRVNTVRKNKNFARAYGGAERVAWIRQHSCCVCEFHESVNAHLPSKSGAGRKGDAKFIVPLCANRMEAEGCHEEMARMGVDAFQEKYRINLYDIADQLDATWRAKR